VIPSNRKLSSGAVSFSYIVFPEVFEVDHFVNVVKRFEVNFIIAVKSLFYRELVDYSLNIAARLMFELITIHAIFRRPFWYFNDLISRLMTNRLVARRK
jgi:hypothetical protein